MDAAHCRVIDAGTKVAENVHKVLLRNHGMGDLMLSSSTTLMLSETEGPLDS
jgi:hypothetical protein